MDGGGLRVVRWWWLRHGPLAAPDRIAGQDEAALAPWPLDAPPRIPLPQGAVWLTSPLGRCVASAAYLTSAPPTPEPRLMEQHFGVWQGRRHADLADAPSYADFWRDPAHATPPGGESFAQQCARVAAAVLDWGGRLASNGDGPCDVVAMAHAGTIRAALAQALGLDAAQALAFVVDPLSLTRIDLILGGSPKRGGVGGGVGGGADLAVRPQWRVAGVNLPLGR